MDNFYNEHEGYKALSDKLAPMNLENDLLMVVAEAVLHGIEVVIKNMDKGDKI